MKSVPIKKTQRLANDVLRSEYKRKDFGDLVRGKYASRLRSSLEGAALDPDTTKRLPLRMEQESR